MSVDDLDLTYFRESYLLANNAAQLYAQFSARIDVGRLWEAATADGAATKFQRFVELADGDFESLIKAYVLLVGLTMLDADTAMKALEQVSVEKLQWGPEIKRLYEQRRRSTAILVLNPGAQRAATTSLSTADSTSVSSYYPRAGAIQPTTTAKWAATARREIAK